MRLKEIKPGMVIHCKTKEEMEELSKHIKFFNTVDNIWNYGNDGIRRDCVWIDDDGRYGGFDAYRYFAVRNNNITEFSDLILPDLTAEEAIEWLAQHRLDDEYENAFGFASPFDEIINEECTAEDIVKGIAQWKADHEKKEPEIETVDICRIIEIQPDGRKRCVHEEDISDGELMYSGDAVEKCRYILKNYCMEHDGEFIAVHEVVSRVKK